MFTTSSYSKRFTCLLLFLFFIPTAFAQQLPIPDWVKDIGGTGESKLSGIAVDKFDNVYVAGNFQNTLTADLSGISTAVNLTSKGNYDIYIAKYTPDGKLLWAKSLGGTGLDQVNNLAVDNNGNILIAAAVESAMIDCDPGPGTSNINLAGGYDALVVKFDTEGNYIWARNVGGPGTERGHVVSFDQLGNVLLVGSFASASINLGTYTLTNSSPGNDDGFMAKYDPNGNLLWAYKIGSTGTDEIKSVKANSNNEILIMGYFTTSANMNPQGTANTMNGSGITYFLNKYTGTGALIWTNKIDGPNNPTVSSLAVGPADDIYITGIYANQINFNSANTITLSNASNNLFVAKYSSAGRTTWAKNIQSTGAIPYSYYLTADLDDNVYIGGYFDNKLIFGEGAATKALTFNGVKDTFFGKYDKDGTFIWAFNFGSACNGNYGHKIAVDSKKNVLLGGAFCGTVDFNPAGNCDLKLTSKYSTSDGFISKYNQIKWSGDPLITSFSLAQQTSAAIIDIPNKTISITVRPGTDVKKLIPKIETDIGVLSPLSDVETDFTVPKVYAISSNCMNYSWIVQVTVDQIQATAYCADESFTVRGTANTNSGTVFQWEIQDGNGNWVNAPDQSTLADYEFKGISNYSNADQIFKLRRKTSLNDIEDYDSEFEITIYPSTTNNTISSAQTLNCNGKANVLILGSIPQGAQNSVLTYKWQQSRSGSNWLDIQNETGKDFSPPEFTQTTWFRRITQADNCQAYSNPLKIEVYPAVTPSNAGTDISLCHTGTVTLNANAAAIDETGSWSVISPIGYQPFDAATMNNPKAIIDHLPEDQEIQLQWTITPSVCTTTSSSIVKIYNYSTPVLTLPARMTIPEGQSQQIPAILTATNASVAYHYLWSPANGLDDPTKLSPLASPDKTTIYHLSITYGNSCSIDQDIKLIVNKSATLVSCPAENLSLEGDAENDLQSAYQWQVLEGGVWHNLTGGIQKNYDLVTTENFSNTTRHFEYRRRVTNQEVYYDSYFKLDVSPKTTNNSIRTETTTFCAATVEKLLIKGTMPIGAVSSAITYSWEKSTDGNTWQTIPDQSSQDLLLDQLSETNSYRRTTYAGNCISLSNVLIITINRPATIAEAGQDSELCGITTVQLNANEPGENETGTWSIINPVNYQPFSVQNIHDPKAILKNFPQNEVVNLRWTIENHNCTTYTSDDLTILSNKTINLQVPAELTINAGQKILLGAIADLSGHSDYTLNWSPKTGLSTDNILNPEAKPFENTLYTLTINYGQSCSQTASILVRVLKKLDIPNSFSPNNDGTNDIWTIKNINNYPGSKVSIFNRYGTIIYQSTGYSLSWDGTYKGKQLPVGTYFYVIDLKDMANTTFKGSITILH